MAKPASELALSTSLTVTSEARVGAAEVVSSLVVMVDADDNVGASLVPVMVMVTSCVLVESAVPSLTLTV